MLYIGIDVGGTSAKAGVVDERENTLQGQLPDEHRARL